MEVNFLSQHLCSPREGHLDAVYRIFRYLQKKLGRYKGGMTYDLMYEPEDEKLFEIFGRDLDEWKEFYPDAQEIIPRHMPEALGKNVAIQDYVDANYSGNMANRR